LNIDDVIAVNLTAIQNRLPDVTLFIDIDPVTSLDRRMNASKADRLESEKIQFHERAYKGYLELSDKFSDRIVKINGKGNIREIANEMIDVVDGILKRREV
jgi:dTMP kinase